MIEKIANKDDDIEQLVQLFHQVRALLSGELSIVQEKGSVQLFQILDPFHERLQKIEESVGTGFHMAGETTPAHQHSFRWHFNITGFHGSPLQWPKYPRGESAGKENRNRKGLDGIRLATHWEGYKKEIHLKHALSILVKNRPGVMSHVSGLFTRRGFNIDSIAVGVTDNPDISIMTIVLRGDENTLTQFQGQLLKLADVIKVKHLPYHDSIIRELLLVRVEANVQQRSEIFGIVEVFGGRIAEITDTSILIEMNGNPRQVNGVINMLSRYGIREMARTGQIALAYETETEAETESESQGEAGD